MFALFWVIESLAGYGAIQAIGYATAPAIWAGLTIVVSFVWGVAAFDDGVKSGAGAAGAILLLVVGICLAASTQSSFPGRLRALVARCRGGGHNSGGGRSASYEETTALIKDSDDGGENGGVEHGGGGKFVRGVLLAVCVGFLNGSLMVPMKCFATGCFGAEKYDPVQNGGDTAGLAFLPYLAVGLAIATPVVFGVYFRAWRPGLSARVALHAGVAAGPGLLTGCYWAMGNYSAIFATMYLGQAIGYPLTQTAIVVNGLWGIAYYREIRGKYPVGVFYAAVVVIICGAVLDGRYA